MALSDGWATIAFADVCIEEDGEEGSVAVVVIVAADDDGGGGTGEEDRDECCRCCRDCGGGESNRLGGLLTLDDPGRRSALLAEAVAAVAEVSEPGPITGLASAAATFILGGIWQGITNSDFARARPLGAMR